MRAFLLVIDMRHIQKLLLLLTLLLFSSSCNRMHYPQYNVTSILPRDSFVKIEVNVDLETCIPTMPDTCITNRVTGHASGVVVKKLATHSFVLTAGHVCVNDYEQTNNQKVSNMKLYAIDIDNVKHEAKIIKIENSIDVCIISVESIDRPAIKLLYKRLEAGEKVYNLAAPAGMFYTNMIPILEGRYVGIDQYGNAMYTIPAIGGSSGSPIIDDKGVLVGMVHSVHRRFHHLSFSPTTVDLYNFILYATKNEPYSL